MIQKWWLASTESPSILCARPLLNGRRETWFISLQWKLFMMRPRRNNHSVLLRLRFPFHLLYLHILIMAHLAPCSRGCNTGICLFPFNFAELHSWVSSSASIDVFQAYWKLATLSRQPNHSISVIQMQLKRTIIRLAWTEGGWLYSIIDCQVF